MKKLILSLCLFLAASQLIQAQLDFGIKAGVNYNSDSFQNIDDVATEILEDQTKSKTGFHAGIWLRAKLPVMGLYIRPELVYTALKSELTANDGSNTKASYDFQKIDIPVLLGKKIFKIAYIHAGPSFQYILDGDLDFDTVGTIVDNFETEVDGFTVGLNIGAGIELGKIGLDVRWDRSFSDTESEIISRAAGSSATTKFDTRVNQIIIGLSYRF